MPGSSGTHWTSAPLVADTSSKSPCSSRRPGRSVATAHDGGASDRFPLRTVGAAVVRRRYPVVGFHSQYRDCRSPRARGDLFLHLQKHSRDMALCSACTDHPPAPPPSPLLRSPPGSTPIGRTGQRGFVQSGFNDVPHCAVPGTAPRDLVEPSCIPVVRGAAIRPTSSAHSCRSKCALIPPNQRALAFGTTNRGLRSPFARTEHDLPLPKPVKGTILAPKLPGNLANVG